MNPTSSPQDDSIQTTGGVREDVREYYGRVLGGKRDLRTSACCTEDALPDWQREILSLIEPEVLEKFYGCGSPIPPLLDGLSVLDLGCGTGRDVFMAAKLAGRNGHVIGVDMTEEQLAVGQRHLAAQMSRFGFNVPNVTFRHGYIEDLVAAGVADNSVDVVVSNCVINLSPDKPTVMREIFRVLKPGGELYFSDVFAGCRVPAHHREDPVLYGECLAGALYTEDFRRMLRDVGVLDARVVSRRPITIGDPAIAARIGNVDFYSMTYRAFKLDTLEDICEDYGQVATYRGTIARHAHRFALDDHHEFIAGKPMLVCGNTASMLSETRLAPHFKVVGNRSQHFGPFDCSPASSRSGESKNAGGACC